MSVGLEHDIGQAAVDLRGELRAEMALCENMLVILSTPGPYRTAELQRLLGLSRTGPRIGIANALGRLEAWQAAALRVAAVDAAEASAGRRVWRGHELACPVDA